MKLLIIISLGFLVGLFADIKKDISICSEKKGELTRLDCYDSLAIKYKLSKEKSTEKIQGKGKWNVFTETNPLNDTKTVILSLDADSGLSKWGKVIRLYARCQNNTTELFIDWDSYLGRNARVTTRIGDTKATKKNWGLSTDSQATFYSGKTISLLRNMVKNDKAVFQVTPYNDNPITAIFDIKGLENAIKPLSKTCGWNVK